MGELNDTKQSLAASLVRARAHIDRALRLLGADERKELEPLALGAFIALQREELGLSLQEVAQAAWITKAHVWDLEHGRAGNPTLQTICGLARALGVQPLTLCRAAIIQYAEPTGGILDPHTEGAHDGRDENRGGGCGSDVR